MKIYTVLLLFFCYAHLTFAQSAPQDFQSCGTSDSVPIWIYDYEPILPKHNRKINSNTPYPESLVKFINSTKGGDTVRLELLHLSNDTIFLKINNSKILTQQVRQLLMANINLD